MTIQTGDIKLLKSQVLLDTTDGGGAMTALEVQDGVSNNLFPDVSELDRTYGRVAMRKAFPAVQTSTNDSYYGSHVIVSRMPQDPRVAVSLFTTKDWTDRRTAARDKIERYLARGPKWPGHLLETQLEGQRAIQLAVRPTDEEPKVGQGLALVQFEGLPTEFEQYVRVTKVTATERLFTVGNRDVTRKILTVEISDPLRFNFEGPTVEQFETNSANALAFCRDTRVANAATYYGVSKLTQAGVLNDASVQVGSIYTQLVPSASSETPMVDLTASGMSSLFVPSNNNPITVTINTPMSPGSKLYLGTAVVPGSLSLNAGGNVVTDAGGVLKYNGTDIGNIEYDKGLLAWTANAFSHNGAKQITFQPAAVPSRVADTASISIVQDTRGYNYTITLLPIPVPASLVVSYMAQGKVYYLYDKGNGVLKGSDAAFGTGAINYATGSVIITTGALPDAGSELIFAWGKRVTTFTRSNIYVPPAYFEFTLAHEQVTPNQVQITWTVAGVPKTATDDGSGNLTGDATGSINYGSGKIKLIPSLLVQKGTVFTVNYQWGEPNSHTFPMPVRSANGDVSVVVNAGAGIVPKSVEVAWNVNIIDSPELDTSFMAVERQTWNPPPPWTLRDPLVQGLDNGNGTFRRADGTLHTGSINYTNGQITFTPEVPVKIPRPQWVNVKTGEVFRSQVIPVIGGGTSTLETTFGVYRRVMTAELVNTVATMPYDETGYVIVKWRNAAGSTAATDTFTADDLIFDLTPDYAETIVGGSVRFVCGGLTYIDRLGGLYHSIDPTNGSGTAAGSIQYQTGRTIVQSWVAGQPNALTLQSLATEVNMDAVDEVVFRVPITPVRAGSVQVRAIPIDGGEQVSVTVDANGRLNGSGMIGAVDFTSGVVRIRFGVKRIVTPAIQAASWFVPEAVFTEDGVQKIIEPKHVYPDSVRYNAVGFTYLPLSASILGLDPVRLPSDGRVPIFRMSDVVVVHHTDSTPFPGTPAVGTVLNVGRVRLSALKVQDSAGTALDPNMYNVDLDAGTVTLKANYSLGALALPLYAEHRIEDMAVVTDVQINGRLALNRPLTHSYPANSTLVSSALIMGDLQGRVYGKFSQESWTNVWSDSRIGNTTTSQYNDTLYPITTKNKGSTEERWALIFTSNTQFRIVGEAAGQIGTGNINTDTAPLNPATNTPYFELAALGWGSGWAAGNVLRFNTAAANYPIWMARTVLQGPATALSDSFQIQIRGDIDR